MLGTAGDGRRTAESGVAVAPGARTSSILVIPSFLQRGGGHWQPNSRGQGQRRDGGDRDEGKGIHEQREDKAYWRESAPTSPVAATVDV